MIDAELVLAWKTKQGYADSGTTLEEHDEQIRADTFEEIEKVMYHEAFEVSHEKDGLQKWDSGNWIRYKLFENAIEQLKE